MTFREDHSLDDAEDDFAAGVAGGVGLLGGASFRERENPLDDWLHFARIDEIGDSLANP